jgi:hypothetical protein
MGRKILEDSVVPDFLGLPLTYTHLDTQVRVWVLDSSWLGGWGGSEEGPEQQEGQNDKHRKTETNREGGEMSERAPKFLLNIKL